MLYTGSTLCQYCRLRTYLDPGLLVEVCDIELAAGGMWKQFVMLLQDFVESLKHM